MYCWQHLRKEMGLRVSESRIRGAGKGLFATRDFHPGEMISKYTGDVLGQDDLYERYEHNDQPYVLCIDVDHCIDARSTQAAVARYANACDHPRTGRASTCNSRFIHDALVATKHIWEGDEILVPYQRHTWYGEESD